MKCTQLTPLKYKDSKMNIHYTKYLQTRLYENDASSSDAISPDFLYDLPDLIVARLSTGIPWLPPNVTGEHRKSTGEHSQTFNSTDFDGMKCTQLTPLKYKNSKMIHYTKYLQTSCTKMMQFPPMPSLLISYAMILLSVTVDWSPPMPSLLISYTIFQILLSLDCRLESHSNAISPDFLYDLTDPKARLST